MAVEQALFPYYGQAQVIATTSTPQDVTFPNAKDAKQFALTVTGANGVFFRVKFTGDTAVASSSDALVNNVNRILVSKGDQTVISVVSPAGASSVHIIPADGATTM